jgi:hypothetical protein
LFKVAGLTFDEVTLLNAIAIMAFSDEAIVAGKGEALGLQPLWQLPFFQLWFVFVI